MNRFDLTTPDGTLAQRRTYHSVDSVVQGEQRRVYPTEFLNSLSMSGVPPHTLTLQEGCPVILLRNMSGGLANGTQLIVVKLMQHIIDDAPPSSLCDPRGSKELDLRKWSETWCRSQLPALKGVEGSC
jgi:hypothetical protein